MSEITIIRLIYATIAILAGITVGIVVAVFLSVLRFLEILISFPLEIYRALISAYKTRLMMQAFNVGQPHIEEDRRTPDEKMWDRHIERMKQKKSKEDQPNNDESI